MPAKHNHVSVISKDKRKTKKNRSKRCKKSDSLSLNIQWYPVAIVQRYSVTPTDLTCQIDQAYSCCYHRGTNILSLEDICDIIVRGYTSLSKNNNLSHYTLGSATISLSFPCLNFTPTKIHRRSYNYKLSATKKIE